LTADIVGALITTQGIFETLAKVHSRIERALHIAHQPRHRVEGIHACVRIRGTDGASGHEPNRGGGADHHFADLRPRW